MTTYANKISITEVTGSSFIFTFLSKVKKKKIIIAFIVDPKSDARIEIYDIV